MIQLPAKVITPDETFAYRYSICTLVSDITEYKNLIQSFFSAGFTEENCEFLYIDNTLTNIFDAYSGLNRFLRTAKGEFIILCHQDIHLHDHGIRQLDKIIQEITELDNRWAILGNSGGVDIKRKVRNLTEGNGQTYREAAIPFKTMTVDENFILVKNQANLALSSNLQGFHMYGADICIIAEVLGYNSYIIDFHITHKSGGNADSSFYQLKRDLILKYKKAFRGRFLSTTITRFYISGSALKTTLFNTAPVLFLARQYFKYFRKTNYYTAKK